MKKRKYSFLILSVLLLSLFSCADSENEISIYVMDVGQGDCLLIDTGDGYVMIDTGPEDSEAFLLYQLEEMGVTEISYLIFTHNDTDHVGGADGIARTMPIGEVWVYDQTENDSINRFYATVSEDTDIHQVTVGETLDVGDVSFHILAPLEEDAVGNEKSLVLKMAYGSISALFMGDATDDVEELMLETYDEEELKADLLKVGHHGSYTSTSDEFVAVVQPEIAVICCAKENTYGHPHGVVLTCLEKYDVDIYRTDLLGQMEFCTDGETIWFEEAK